MKMNKILIVSFIYYIQFISTAFGNGAGWDIGLSGKTPGPIMQNKLFIEKEYVVFAKPKVVANFWINNPTDKSIEITMGFPFKCNSNFAEEDSIKQIVERDRKLFDVKVNDSTVEYQINYFNSKDYPAVINWVMLFPSQSISKFIVTYPYIMGSFTGDTDTGYQGYSNFQYITHTGSYWAKPIKEAVFEYYGEGMSLIENNPSGKLTICKNDGFDIEMKSIKISPSPYAVDKIKHCIRWKRNNWSPQKDLDDISIYIEKSKDYYIPDGGSFKEIFFKWCGLTSELPDNYIVDKYTKLTNKQFADLLDLDTKLLSKPEIDKLFSISYEYVTKLCDGDWCDPPDRDPFYSFPDHLSDKYKLNLLRYLRNYIAAKTGHRFKNQKLSKCFSGNEKHAIELNQIQRENIKIIVELEKEINTQYKELYKKMCTE